LITNDY